MSMERYELIRDEGYKLLWKNDRAFEHGESPTAKVISFFCKRKHGDVEVNLKDTNKKEDISFEILIDLSTVKSRLDKTLRYKKKWYGDQDIYNFVALQNYVDQCESGGYSKCLISKKEFAMISPKKK